MHRAALVGGCRAVNHDSWGAFEASSACWRRATRWAAQVGWQSWKKSDLWPRWGVVLVWGLTKGLFPEVFRSFEPRRLPGKPRRSGELFPLPINPPAEDDWIRLWSMHCRAAWIGSQVLDNYGICNNQYDIWMSTSGTRPPTRKSVSEGAGWYEKEDL